MYPPDDSDDVVSTLRRVRQRPQTIIDGVDFTGSNVDPNDDTGGVESTLKVIRSRGNLIPPEQEPEPATSTLGRAWQKIKKYGGYSPLREDIGRQFSRAVDNPDERDNDNNTGIDFDLPGVGGVRLPTSLAALKSFGAGAGEGFFDTLRATGTPVGLATLAEKPAAGAYGLAGTLGTAAINVGAGIFAGEGLEQALDSKQSIGHRVLGGVNALMGGLQLAHGRPVPETPPRPRPLSERPFPLRGHDRLTDGITTETVYPDQLGGREQRLLGDGSGPSEVIDGEIIPQADLPPGPPGPPELPGGDQRLLPGNVNVRYGDPSSLDPVGYLTGDVPRGTPLGPSPNEGAPRLPGRIHPDFVREHGPGVAPTLDDLAGVEDVPGGPPLAPQPPYGLQPPTAAPDAFQPPLPPTEDLEGLFSDPAPTTPPPPRLRGGTAIEDTRLGQLVAQANAEGENAAANGDFGDFFADPLEDPLTKLPNRRAWETSGKANPDRIHARIDLDNFKALNDIHGHEAGDRALQAVSDALRKRLRKGDEIARLGGDEFGIRLGLEHGDPAAHPAFRDELERAVDEALRREGLHQAGGKKVGASIGFGADEAAADAAAMARKAERGVSKPRANVLEELPDWVREEQAGEGDEFAGVLKRAQAEGYTGSSEELHQRYLDEIKAAEGLNSDLSQEWGGDPKRLLRLIAKHGGLRDVPELKGHRSYRYEPVLDNQGRAVSLKNGKPKMRKVLEDVGGVKGVFNDSAGMDLPSMVKRVQANPEFAHITDPRDLLNAFDDAAHEIRHGKGRELSPNLGEGWWRRLDDEPPAGAGQLPAAGEDGPVAPDDIDDLLEARAGEAISNANQGRSVTEEGIQPIAESGKLTRRAREEAAGSPRWKGTRGDDLERIVGKLRDLKSSSKEAIEPQIDDILDTGEVQPRLPGAGEARQAGASDTTFKAPQQATGDDFDLEHLLGDGVAERIDKEQNPDLFGDSGTPADDTPAPKLDDPADVAGERASGLQQTAGDNPPAQAPVASEPAGPGVPPNVRDFLTRQLKYTPEQVAAMEPAEAIRIGKERVQNPDYVPSTQSAAPVEASGVVGPDRPNTRLGKELSAQERRTNLQRTRVKTGATPTTVEGAPAPTTPAQKLAAGQKLTEKELKQAGLTAPDVADKVRPKLREMGLSPRQLDQRAVRMAKYLEDPTADNFERWVQDVMGQAERSNAKDFKAGTASEGKTPPKHRNGEYLASGPGSLLALGKDLYKNDPAAFRVAMQAGAGALAGALTDSDDPLRGGIYGALAGAALTPSGARAFRKAFSRLAGKSGAGRNVGLHDLRAGRDLKKDIGWGEMIFGSPERVVPDVFKKANDTLDELQDLWQKKPSVAGKAEKLYMHDVIADMREAAEEAESAGLKRRAWYANKLADALSKKPTAGQLAIKKLGDMAGLKLTGRELENFVGGNVYRVLTGYALDTALQNLSQPILALAHVPPKFMKAGYQAIRTAEGKAATAFLELKKPIDATDDVLGDLHLPAKSPEQLKGLEGLVKDPQRALRKSDSFNRKVVYLGAREYAKSTGAAEKAAHDYAMGVVRKTQGNTGPMGNNPFQRGVAASFVKPFTKYPTMYVEHMIDVFNQPDAAGRNRLVLTMLGIMGAGHVAAMASGGQTPDLGEMLLSGGRPLGISLTHPMRSAKRIASFDKSPFPVVRAGHDALMHITGQADHSALSDAPQAIAGRFPAKAFDELSHFFKSGTDDHMARTPSGAADPHSGLEGLENLLGMRSERQIDQSDLMNDAYDERDRLQADDAATKKAARAAYVAAVDAGDVAEMRKQAAIIGSRSARAMLKGKDKTRFERLLANSPKKIRQQLSSEFGDRAQGVKLP